MSRLKKYKPTIYLFALCLVVFTTKGCTDIYEPEIEQVTDQLVVEGLVTDQPGPHLVKLSRSSVFGEPFRRVTLGGATVSITQNQQSVFQLEETRTGYYYTPESFMANVGDTLVLKIETTAGLFFESKPQILMPPVNVDGVFSVLSQHVFTAILQPSGILKQYNFDVGNVFLSMAGDENVPRFRLATSMVVDYSASAGNAGYLHCWIRKPINDYLETDVRENQLIGQPQEHLIGFAPQITRGLPFMGFPDYVMGTDGAIFGTYRVLISYFYSMNEDAYNFHEARNKQLNDEGRFFDPIAAQLPGNILCISDPKVPVFGLFEVSSVSYTPVWVQFHDDEVSARIVHLIDTISDTGCYLNTLPPFLNDMN